MRKFFALFLIFVGIFSTAAPVLACEPPPPSYYIGCNDLGAGYAFGMVYQTAQNGRYYFTSAYGTRIGGAPSDNHNYVEISDSDLHTFNWAASMGIDAVIVYAGQHSEVTTINEQLSGAGYHGAVDSNGVPYAIDGVSFCYDYELAVDVQAEGTATGGSTTWDITKTVDDTTKTAFAGDAATFNYTVGVTALAGPGGDSSFGVETVVTIQNNSPLNAWIVGGSATLDPGNINLMDSEIDCGGLPISFPAQMAPWSEFTCTIDTELESQLLGTATVVVNTTGNVGGASDTADIVWNVTPGTGGASTVNVTDTNPAFEGPRTTSVSQSWNYPVTISCPDTPSAYANGPVVIPLDNTARIVETNQSASQSVSLTCYAPTVDTSASANYDVQYAWTIDKNSELTEVELDVEETLAVPYTVTVNATGTPLPGGVVSGQVTIGNPNPETPMLVTLADTIATGLTVTYDCANPVTVPAGGSTTCAFTAAVDTLPAGDYTAQVTLNDITFSDTATFTGGIGNKIDESITVNDDRYGLLGDVTSDMVESGPYTFQYNQTIGPYPADEACRETSFINTASFETVDTHTYADDTYILDVKVKCPVITNCVRTYSWWYAHSDPADPANYNPTWDLVGELGPSTPFFDYGHTWRETLGMSGSGTYLLLAKEYIAAKLNVLFGALPPENIATAISDAEYLLDYYDTRPGEITGTVITQFRNARTLLNSFNRGAAGVPMCTDCSTSSSIGAQRP